MNKVFEMESRWNEPSTIEYAIKLLDIVKKAPLPDFKEYQGISYHPDMIDPYWGELKNIKNYNSIEEWQSQVAVEFATGLNSLYGDDYEHSNTPLPSQKTFNDWFELSLLKDGSLDGVIGNHSLPVAYFYNQDDPIFDQFESMLEQGTARAGISAGIKELIETGEYYTSTAFNSIKQGYISLDELKHPFWKGFVEKTLEAGENPSSVAPYTPGESINTDAIPTPNYEAGGLIPTTPPVSTDLSQAQVDKLLELYIGFFGRAVEYSGLEWHKANLDKFLKDGLSETEAFNIIADQFWEGAKEYGSVTGYSENMPTFDFVQKVYTNVLGRPDALENDREGIDFWTGVMESSGTSKGQMVLMMLESAHQYIEQNPDDLISIYVESLLDNRTEISLFFAEEAFSGHLFGEEAIQVGVDVINRIDPSYETVEAVKAALSNGTLYDLEPIQLVGTGTVPGTTLSDDFFF